VTVKRAHHATDHRTMADEHVHDPARSARLEDMLDRGQIAAVLDEVGLVELARAWSCYHGRTTRSDDVDWWAIAVQHELGDLPLPHRREVILALVEHVDDATLGVVAAGPLEAHLWHDEDTLRWLEQAVVAVPRLREAIAGVWVDFPDDVMGRLDAMATRPLTRAAR
jgi:hypothetical protein